MVMSFDAETRGMADIERMTITLPAAMASLVKRLVDDGDNASSSEVVREALRDWSVIRHGKRTPLGG